jgi:CubicO group peptidase (beta-lactamase class C family)
MASMGPDGGAVSTAGEQITFLRAFMSGALFPVESLGEMTRQFHTVFFPISAGTGIQRFAAPRIMTLGRRLPTLLGHGGASGTVLFHAPSADLWVAGSVNQLQNRPQVYQLMMRLLMKVA